MFHRPKAISAEPRDAPANTLGIRRIMFAVDESRTSFLRNHGAELLGRSLDGRTRTSVAEQLEPKPPKVPCTQSILHRPESCAGCCDPATVVTECLAADAIFLVREIARE